MRVFWKWLGRLLLVCLLAAAVIGFWNREQITRLMAVNTLFDESKIVHNFSHMKAAFLTTPVARGDHPVSPLPKGAPLTLPKGAQAWIKERNITSLLVLSHGQIIYEDYFLGTAPQDHRISWSMAKSYLSALFGILAAEGAVASLDDPVVKYAPTLKGSAYDKATIRQVLTMTTGITFDEDYLDYNSDINRMGRVLALGGKMDEFAAGLTETFATPGTTWQYTSIDTHVLGMVIRGATGRNVPELMSEKLLARLGPESDAHYLTDGTGVAFVLGGLNLTTRDYARFGAMIAAGGKWQGEQIVPADWVAESTAPQAPTEPGKIGYGYQWWIPVGSAAGQFMGRGIYGQYLYIDQKAGVVIVMTAADRQFRDTGVNAQNVAMMRAITEAAR